MKKYFAPVSLAVLITAAFLYLSPHFIHPPIEKPELPLLPEVNLEVPFYPQAPDGNWDMPWQEACEESATTLAYFYATAQDLTKDTFRARILEIVDWENKTYGYFEHTNMDETARILAEVYNYSNFEIVRNITAKDLKKALSERKVIIAPFAGRLLGNPFYSGEGPYYHAMVIKGYGDGKFITHDVGTKRGEDYAYDEETLMNALHDWHDDDITKGNKTVIVVSPSA